MIEKINDDVTKQLIKEYKKKYSKLNQAELRLKNATLLNKLRYRLGPKKLAEIVPKKISNLDRTAYQQEYYELRKSEIKKSRKDRYENDTDYRKAIAKNSKEFRKRKKPKDWVTLQEEKHAPYKTFDDKPRMFEIDGEEVALFRLIHLAGRVGYDSQTLLNWEAAEVLPEPTAEDQNGERWYSERFVKWFTNVITERVSDGIRTSLKDFAEIVQTAYESECQFLEIDSEVERL